MKQVNYFEEFRTKIDGMDFQFQAGKDCNSNQFYAQAFLLNDMYCNTAFSEESIEDAILKLVKLLENDK